MISDQTLKRSIAVKEIPVHDVPGTADEIIIVKKI